MSVKIRLTRAGRRNRPYYRVAVMDTRTRRDGRCIEVLGTYDPLIADMEASFTIDKDRTEYWLSQGALPSHAVLSFLRRNQIGDLSRARKPRRRRPKAKD